MGGDQRSNRDLAAKMFSDLMAIKRPYDRQRFRDLPEEKRDLVHGAESDAFLIVTVSVAAKIDDKAFQEGLHAQNVFVEDDDLIDDGLIELSKLASAYETSGLANTAEDAKIMANAFKKAIAQHQKKRTR